MILNFGSQMLVALNELIEWESIVMHLIALVILTVGLYFLLFKPVKRMIKERQDKIRKIEKENSDLSEEVKKMKESSEIVLAEARKEAAVIHENAVKVANQKADEIEKGARAQAKNLIERTEQELEEERRKLGSDIEKQIAEVSVAVAQKVISRDITPADNKKLIEDSLTEWSKNS